MAGPGNLFEGEANGALSKRSNARESKGSREGGLLVISTNVVKKMWSPKHRSFNL